MIHFPEIETQRLYLRELDLTDCASVLKHFADPDVTQFMDIEPCKDIHEAEEIIHFHMDDSGCRYGIFDKTSGEFVGTIGFHCWVRGTDSRAEIGFDLSRKYWGLGLMQEALIEIIRVGFDIMELDLIEATVEQDNTRSQRLLHKMRFSRAEDLRENLYYYTLMKEDLGER